MARCRRAVDLVFAEPPYNLQLAGELLRPTTAGLPASRRRGPVAGFAEYDRFTRTWLERAALLNPRRAWASAASQYLPRRAILQDLGYHGSNDIAGANQSDAEFPRRRFTNAHETLLWCSRSQDSRTPSFEAMKALTTTADAQRLAHSAVRRPERMKRDGKKAPPYAKARRCSTGAVGLDPARPTRARSVFRQPAPPAQ